MSLAGYVLSARTDAEGLMRDRCVIDRAAGVATDADGNVTTVRTTVYTGRCKVQLRNVMANEAESAGAIIALRRLEVHIPAAVTAAAVGDLVTVTATELDRGLVGKTFRVTDVPVKTYATARRLACEEQA